MELPTLRDRRERRDLITMCKLTDRRDLVTLTGREID
ncbi:hypothetical protein E2C01_102295 [Portunus trituberculatus]|uniref:Uncharacterized protein n=1 Tax=Portunus trituberculatus TaxID=210409 RepID=A0A5B7KC72_PORTR|nr:hypothetical protein [Portunus trituberculatus]